MAWPTGASQVPLRRLDPVRAGVEVDDVSTQMPVGGDPVGLRRLPGEREDRPRRVANVTEVGRMQTWQIVDGHCPLMDSASRLRAQSSRHGSIADDRSEVNHSMATNDSTTDGQLLHLVTLKCKDDDHAQRCLGALEGHGKPDALAFDCVSYEFGLEQGTLDTVYIVERWNRWEDLDSLLTTKVVPALPTYNELLERPFDPERDTVRIQLAQA